MNFFNLIVIAVAVTLIIILFVITPIIMFIDWLRMTPEQRKRLDDLDFQVFMAKCDAKSKKYIPSDYR